MIVKIGKPGRSFVKLALYLGHDIKADTTKRVAWTHTLNCAHDHVPSAVHEMYTTWLDADFLKQEAGVPLTGRKLEKPVKHFSLNWDPSEKPTPKEMVAAVESYLTRMGWQDHQAVLIAHSDKKYRHVHVMLNAVHPETGLRLQESYEHRRTAAWCEQYERAHGIVCEERLKPVGQRAKSPPRPVWERLQGIAAEGLEPIAFDRPEVEPHLPPGWKAEEWKHLKALQREQRDAFFAGGKDVYRGIRNQIYQEVRQTYRAEWAEYFALKRADAAPDVLQAFRDNLVAQQKETLDHYARIAANEVRTQRDIAYRALLDRQKAEREVLTDRQKHGVSSSQLWHAKEAARLRAEIATVGSDAVPPALTAAEARRTAWTQRAGMVAQQRSASRWKGNVTMAASPRSPSSATAPPEPATPRPGDAQPPNVAAPSRTPERNTWEKLLGRFGGRFLHRARTAEPAPGKKVGVEPDL